MTKIPESCPDPETVARWLEGNLPEEEGVRLAAHLADCDGCRRAAALAATMGPVPQASLDEGLLKRVVTSSRQPRARRWMHWAAALLGAAAGLLWIAWPRERGREEYSPRVARPPALPVPVPPPSAGLPTPKPEVREEATVPPPPPPVPLPGPVVEPPAPREAEEPRGEMAPKPAAPAPREGPEPPKEPEPPREEAPVPGPRPESPGRTTTDPSEVFAAVFAVDPKGDLWIRRGPGEPAPAGAFEDMDRATFLSARDGAAGFTLEGRATVVLERGAEAVFCYFKPEQAYAVDLLRGLVMIDTEGAPQNWRASCGEATLRFPSLDGRMAIEARGGGMLSALLLQGRGGFRAGPRAGTLEVGREMVVSPEGRFSSRRAETRSQSRRFAELRPPFLTLFAAPFDGGKEDRIFPCSIETGHLLREGSGGFLRALPSEQPGRVLLAAGIRLSRPVAYEAGLVLRFRFRSPVPSLTVRLGRFSASFSGRASAGRWEEGEIPVSRFEHEGVPIVPLEEITGIRFEAVLERGASGRLDVDGIQLGRRAP